MRSNYLKATLQTAVLAVTVLLLGAGLAVAQQQVNLTAAPSSVMMPDGNTVQMWGYQCGAVPTTATTATCAALNPGLTPPTAATVWSPVVITVPTGAPGGLQINLTNNLSFLNGNKVPTSLVIVGQLGGGLGTTATSTPSPDHSTTQTTATWPIVGANADTSTPPQQGSRVQSFSTEVAAGATTSLTWANPRPGTYLVESGTHPSIQGAMGLYGILVVTTAPAGTVAGTAYPAVGTTPAVNYNAEIPLLLSEIDPVQNNTASAAVNTAGFSETAVWSGQPGGCGNPSSGPTVYLTCYPPAVNYTPLYYLINGLAFNKNAPAASLFSATPGTAASTVSGTVLVRLVNAGLRMHVPSIVGSQTGTAAPAASGFSLIAEDGNPLPGVTRVQSEVFMAAGKTYDVMINVPAASSQALPIFDRELSLSGNAISRDSGMLAYIGVNGSLEPTTGAFAAVAATVANPDTYNVVAGQSLTVSDISKGLIANDVNVVGVRVLTPPSNGNLILNSDGTFTYGPNSGGLPDHFTYCANGSVSGTPAVCSSGLTATVTLADCSLVANCLEATTGISMGNISYTSKVATRLSVAPPGILSVDSDGAGHPLTVNPASVSLPACTSVAPATPALCGSVDVNGGFNIFSATSGTFNFTYKAQNSQGTVSASPATVSVTFPTASGLAVTVYDPVTKAPITDYRWVIEEDRTFYVDPNCTANPPPAGCPGSVSGTIVPTFGTNFHTSYMPVVATGCTGDLACESGQTVLGQPAVCDVGNGVCRISDTKQAAVDPSQVNLDPNKRYYISVLPGDAANPFIGAYTSAPVCTKTASGNIDTSNQGCGHGMGGAPIPALCRPSAGTTCATSYQPITILTQPSPFPPSKLSVFVFEDDFPLNGEQDGGGGIDVLSPNEPGLGGFNITLFDDAGGSGDATGQMTYDMFNMPLGNSLAGTIDPATGLDSCPIGASIVAEQTGANGVQGNLGITGTIVTCPKYEADGETLSPLAGQAVVANLMPGRYGVVATPAADRIARGEEWLQTNTLDGQKAHDSFLRIGEPSFFQEFGPAGYHVSIGFANPGIINARHDFVCNGTDPNITGTSCTNTITGIATTERMSRTPDERLYSSGDNSSFAFTQCYVSFGDADGEDFAFTKCNGDGSFTLTNLPDGDWRITIFDQWNDMLVDGLSTPVRLNHITNPNLNMGQIAMNQWQSNIYTKTFFDANGNGIQDPGEDGLTLVATNNRFRDGSYSNFNNTDLAGNAGFNEIFPLFSWYVIEDDTTRYKSTGTHVVYDAGGPADTAFPLDSLGNPLPCPAGKRCSNIGGFFANTLEQIPVPTPLRVPGAFYCATADCTDAAAPFVPGGTGGSTGRIDPATPFGTEGWQGFSGQNSFVEFGKKPYAPGETGGIHGEVIYASTRPFDDPGLLIHTSWTPDVPGVTVNLYQEGTAADGTTSLKLIDHTTTSSWDDWAQGFRTNGNPNMNCPGQGTATGTNADLFFFTIFNQPMWLDVYANGGAAHTVPNNSQFKCYDGMHNWNQVQPAPYDGYYTFPSVTSIDLTTGKWTGSNCTGCVPNPDISDPIRGGTPMLPPGKYVVEMVVPPGYELVKEEDKNILIGDNYIAPVTQQFAGLSDIFILPDQAEVSSNPGTCNPTTSPTGCNAQQSTQTLGRTTLPSHEGDTGSVESFWPCVGALRVVPDYISLFPQSKEVSPFAGATRNLCDRKEITLTEQESALAKFWIFTSAHVAAHFTGVITDDYTSEFDPFSPQFGEKFSPPNLPVSIKDWSGTEVSRVYPDQWGTYDGLTYSTWEVNPPNPTGYAPTMMVVCMNDPGPIPDPAHPGQTMTDPLFNPQYSQFCYEIPFMPGQTQYMDTPVVPTSAFAGAGYNNPDCAYPDQTPAVSEVDGDGIGPWVSAAGNTTLHIHSLGDQTVPNNAYSGPSFTGSGTNGTFGQKTVTRHYGFGSAAGTVALVGSDGVAHPLTGVSWSDTTITGGVPVGVPNCVLQQQPQYSGSTAQCGQLVITAANGKQSIDTVTVTIGGKPPTHVAASDSIQAAIDAAQPGDMIIIDPTCISSASTAPCTTTGAVGGTSGIPAGGSTAQSAHSELLLMWKPLRLQGVGAASSIINANTHPAGKMNTWRRQVNCLFGLALNGKPISGTNPYDAANDTGNNGAPFVCPSTMQFQVDRLPLEATVGWDATLNGNLAELLQEPTLMGALEGAAITVLSKGLQFPAGTDPFGADTFPAGTTLLQQVGLISTDHCTDTPNPYPSNFECNPSSIDGLGITDSSQGGGGIFVHAWGHNLEIANNRIYANVGTLSGGINVGQGEFPGQYLAGAVNADPGSCVVDALAADTNLGLPYCFDMNVNVHHNAITSNSSAGDELFSATPAGAGGVSFCSGTDYYKFNYNWLCGNLSSGDGGGLGQLGFVYHGDIEHNSILFNQSTNPTIPANGGGIAIMGAPDVDPTCGATTDQDCLNPLASGPSDGTGPGLVINANLIQGNGADSGSGGGLRLQNINGSEVINFPTTPSKWNDVTVTNNIIINNVAGWDGAGISLVDALNVNIINNTVMSNDTTASSGVLFNTIGAPLAGSQGPCAVARRPDGTCPVPLTTSTPQPAGLVSIQNSTNLTSNLPATILCPVGHGAGGSAPNGRTNGSCRNYSVPVVENDILFNNRAYYIAVGGRGTGTLNQQNIVTLYNAFTTTPASSQPITGACDSDGRYWDIGVRGDTGPTNHAGGTLSPRWSVLTSLAGGYNAAGEHNTATNPTVISQYCDGSRVPPEAGGMGYQVPPGISDATVPNPVFSLTPAATIDEGNNWINISWGPLSLSNPLTGMQLGTYAPAANSPIIDYVTCATTAGGCQGANSVGFAPTLDFFGNPRPDGSTSIDPGAIEHQADTTGSLAPTLTSISPASGLQGARVTVVLTGTNLITVTTVNVSGTGVTATLTSNNSTTVTATLAIAGSATTGGRNVSVTSPSGTSNTVTFTVAAVSGTLAPSPVAFGNQLVGTTSTARSVTFTNTTGVPITLRSGTAGGLANANGPALGINGTNPANFAIVAGTGTTCTNGAVIATGGTCTISVTFTPNATGARAATLNIYAAGATASFATDALTGTGTRAVVAFSGPTALTTGTANRNVKNVLSTITNSGTAPLVISSFTIALNPLTGQSNPGTFSVANTSGATACPIGGTGLAPGTACQLTVTYTPPPAGALNTITGTLTLTDTGAAAPTQTRNYTGN